mgnify:CR=1 FL=1|tara:strand:- start:3543 stop:5246 length:1704 start_codon:yes stop_codon:yes gene_type:complete
MAIEELGESLLGQKRADNAARASNESKARKAARKQQYLGIAGKVIGGIALSGAQQKANAFMRQEPIMAARAKYNAGVTQSIAQLAKDSEAQAHQNGVQGYLRDSYLPLLEAQVKREVDEQEYSKDGFDKYVYDRANSLAIKNVGLFNEATAAATRVGSDKSAFDNFAKVNDGIADTAIGAVGKSISGFFKGKSKEALQQDARTSLISNRYGKDLDALAAANAALAQGLPAVTAAKVGDALANHKASDKDYRIINEEAGERVIEINSKKFTDVGKYVTKVNEWGAKIKVFVSNDPKNNKTYPSITDSTETSQGVTYAVRMIQNTDIGGQNIGPPVRTRTPVSFNVIDIKPQELAEQEADFRRNFAMYKGVSPEANFTQSHAVKEYILQDNTSTDEVVIQKTIDNFYQDVVKKSATITMNTNINAKQYNNPSNLSSVISQHIIINDMERIAESNLITDNEYNFNDSVLQGDPTPFEILEAAGTISKSDSENIDSEYIMDVINSEAMRKEISTLSKAGSKRRLVAYMQSLNARRDDKNFDHFFKDVYSYDSKNPEQKTSIYRMLELAAGT